MFPGAVLGQRCARVHVAIQLRGRGSYQDARIRRRAGNGLAGVVLDLEIVNSVGFVTETAGVKDRLVRGGGHRPLEEAEVLALVAYALQRPRRTPRTAQIVAGNTGAAVPEGKPRFVALSSPSTGSGPTRHGTAEGSGAVVAALHEQMAAAEAVQDGARIVRDTVIAKLAEMFVIPERTLTQANGWPSTGWIRLWLWNSEIGWSHARGSK